MRVLKLDLGERRAEVLPKKQQKTADRPSDASGIHALQDSEMSNPLEIILPFAGQFKLVTQTARKNGSNPTLHKKSYSQRKSPTISPQSWQRRKAIAVWEDVATSCSRACVRSLPPTRAHTLVTPLPYGEYSSRPLYISWPGRPASCGTPLLRIRLCPYRFL
jgi:hypothetical protein